MANVSFNFEIDGAGADFAVVQFSGQESISDLFRFDVDLVSDEEAVDFDTVFNRSARLRIGSGEESLVFDGVFASFQQTDSQSGFASYRAVLVPRLWFLSLNQRNCIYQEMTIPQIVTEVLKEHDFSPDVDFGFLLTKDYAKREYVVQYQETDLNFIARWLEHEGIFYFFCGPKLVFMDRSQRLEPIRGDSTLPYRPLSGLEPVGQESVHSLLVTQQMLPKEVLLKDYNWRRPDLDLKIQGKAADPGRGRVMEYGNHYKDNAEAQRLAQVRGEEIRCRQRQIQGQSDCPRFRAGFRFTLDEHPRVEGEYLLTDVGHQGSQTGAGAGKEAEGAIPTGGDYANTFAAIPADVPFRALRKTPKPRLFGAMNAKVDGAGDGQYAELDEQGRYKVIMPFDVSGKGGGKASRYMRMAQPYSGSNYGMHFPLHKGIEVIWSCIDGDPDRPIICGAVPNPDTSSPVTGANHTKSVIRDYGGNEIILEGLESGKQMRLHSPTHKSTITLGNSIVATTDSEICVRSVESRILIEAKDKITIKVGDASVLEMDAQGNISLKGSTIKINGQLVTEVHGGVTQVTGKPVKINC